MERAQREMNGFDVAQQNLTKAELRRGKRNGRKTLIEQAHGLQAGVGNANWTEADFINTLSHELRTSICVIVGYGDLLLDAPRGGMLQKNQKPILAKIKQNAYYLLDLFTDLIELNRLNGRTGLARREEINIDGLLEEVEAMTQFMPKADGVHLELERPPGLPPLFSNRIKLKIILRNLVGNAIKFTQKGKITIGARFDPNEQMIELSVCDTGVGIDEKDRQRIFDMFWQGDKSQARPLGGVGLGLYLVKQLADQISAKIEVESKKGEGSLFRLRIPVRPS